MVVLGGGAFSYEQGTPVKVIDSRALLVVQVIAKPPFWKGPAQPTLEDDTKESAAK